ncbi:hypothetical protein Ga0074812_13812 [Parafrankia irregularis]|uniref:Uncharacterized protein n=1 Tax=Parafrankia irregularis TaxID=795642 RepID=A0A0S4QYK3_9ACTN|nr:MULTISPECIES: hypothetical protein [Parafrankia]MBE3201424.1 hypothetical protein [Parafrankia sp. CH37]CUU60297.1 hypothetical protein Ga0074812_13812 [Parafrankia irregularis]
MSLVQPGVAWERIRDRRTAGEMTVVSLLVFLFAVSLMPTEDEYDYDGSAVAASGVLGWPSPPFTTTTEIGLGR